ncbi:Uncharacterized protein HZ326_14169 [Fusarium oxysporum f. sp. albedinis]|jgi:hypothetical protein|nr:Uncharacterized protein HZ326_14169 [Fusarium oxysporum f. sp. albedinis]
MRPTNLGGQRRPRNVIWGLCGLQPWLMDFAVLIVMYNIWVECKLEVECTVSMVTAWRLDIVQQFGGVAKPRPLCWELNFS